MTRSTSSHLLVLVLVLALVVSLVPLQTAFGDTPVTPHRVPMINDDFEEDAYRTSLSSWVHNGWEPWYQPGDAVYYREPEFGPLYGREGQWRNGIGSQRWFTSFGTHNCGIFQRVIVPKDSTLTASIWMISWSANNTDQYGKSDSGYSKWIGIDPYGGNNPWSPTIVWSEPNTVMDQWVQLTVSTKAIGNVVTFFTRGEAAFPVKHNTCIIDEARLFSSDPMPGAAQLPATGTTPAAPAAQDATAPGLEGDTWTAQTGFSVKGAWLAWVRANGNIDNTGLPRSNVVKDPTTGQWVQYFQRAILEWHPENPAPFNILRRLMGDIMAPGADPPLANPPANSADYTFFPVTTDPARPTGLGHGVGNIASDGTRIGFKDHFDRFGGVNAFGYPKEEARQVDGVWTQRFQAAVFEYHPENDKDGTIPGTNIPYRAYRVQLRLLGDMYIDQHKPALQ